MNLQESTLHQKTSVKISDILLPPVKCTIPNRHMIEKFAEIAKNDPESLPTIKIGQVNNKLYTINNLDVLQGYKKTNSNTINQIPVEITNYSNLSELIIDHINESLNEQLLNPLSLFDAIDLLQEKGIDKTQILEKIWINDTPYEKIIKLNDSHTSNNSIEQLQNIITKLSERRLSLSVIQIPIYIILKISRIEKEEHQLILINQIDIMLSNIPNGKFAWPTPEQIDTLYSFIKSSDHNREEETEEDDKKESKSKKKDKQKTKSEEQSAEEETTDEYSIPQSVLNHLNSPNIRHKNFDSTQNLRHFIKKLEKRDNVKMTLLWSYC